MSLNKVRYGLSRLHRAKVTRNDDGTVTFGTPVRMPGAVSMTLSPEGSDAKDFYADDGVYYALEKTNGGYTAEIVLARISDEDRVDLLGETLDDNGVQYESTDDKSPEYAYIMEMQGNHSPIAFCFFCGTASRITLNANTKGESVDVDTDTLSVRFIGLELPTKDGTKNLIQGHIERTPTNLEKYEDFFKEVVVPSTSALPATPPPPSQEDDEQEGE